MSSAANLFFTVPLYHCPMTIADRLKQLRTAHDLTQDQFAEICSASKSAVSQWESGATQPSLPSLIALQQRLRFSIDWLVTGEGIGPSGNAHANRLVQLYDKLDDRGKAAVIRVAEAEAAYTVAKE